MKIIELLRGRRSAGRSESESGRTPSRSAALEAARRAMRARDHLGKRRRSGRAGAKPGSRAASPFGAEPEAMVDSLMGSLAESSTEARHEIVPRRAAPRTTVPGDLPLPLASPSTRPASPPLSAPTLPAPRADALRRARGRAPARAALPSRPLPRFVVPLTLTAAIAAGFVVARPLVGQFWLPRVPLARVAVQGASVRTPDSIARALLASAGAPLDRIEAEQVEALVAQDPWIAEAKSLRLPEGTLLVRVVERRAIARYRRGPEEPVGLLDPQGQPFFGEVAAAGALPTVEGPLVSDATIPPAALEILAELERHPDLARHPTILTLRLPEPDAEDGGFVLEIGRSGPRALLGQSNFTRRVARLARLLAERDALLATARVIDLRYADRAVLQTEPTSG